MRLKQWVLEKVRQSAKLKRELMYQLAISESTMYRLLRENSINGDLTRMKAVQIISDELGVPKEEVLEDSKVTA